jgi:hypothetical protein
VKYAREAHRRNIDPTFGGAVDYWRHGRIRDPILFIKQGALLDWVYDMLAQP